MSKSVGALKFLCAKVSRICPVPSWRAFFLVLDRGSWKGLIQKIPECVDCLREEAVLNCVSAHGNERERGTVYRERDEGRGEGKFLSK